MSAVGELRPTPLELPFTCPENVDIDGISLAAVVGAISRGDAVTLASLRAQTTEFGGEFDRLAVTVQSAGRRDYASGARALAQIEVPQWRMPASVFCALAAAASGDIRTGLALANRVVDEMLDLKTRNAELLASRPLLDAGLRCLAQMEQACPRPAIRRDIQVPFSYLVSYPRSGSTMLRLFLAYTFDAPMYSVYPGDARYFSRYFHDTTNDRAVFVKDHEWREAYANEPVLAIVRDGRDSMLSYARYMYGEGYHSYVGAGELADFLSFVTREGIGFWGNHVRQILAARDRGARIRIVRYEELVGNHAALLALARELAPGVQLASDEETAWDGHLARFKKLLTGPGWSEDLAFPEGSYLPANWSVGGRTIDWRRGFDAPARRRFHELGGTEMLQALGYETDAEWWRTD